MINEMILIDATPIKKFIEDGLNCKDPLKAFGHDAIEILAEIEFAPAVDAVEVVRCKDCKRCDGFPKKEIEEDEVGICKVTRMVVFPHFFCNYGDRRAD
jgi:hypothetical protein